MAIKSSDQITVVDLTDGYSVNLTNDSFTFAGDKDGRISTQQSTTTVIQALRGDEEPTIAVDNSEITKPSGVTTSWNANTKTLTITVATSVTSGGVVTIPVVLDGSVTINMQRPERQAVRDRQEEEYHPQQSSTRWVVQVLQCLREHGVRVRWQQLHRVSISGRGQRSSTPPALIR